MVYDTLRTKAGSLGEAHIKTARFLHLSYCAIFVNWWPICCSTTTTAMLFHNTAVVSENFFSTFFACLCWKRSRFTHSKPGRRWTSDHIVILIHMQSQLQSTRWTRLTAGIVQVFCT